MAFAAASSAQQKRQRALARELRASNWWKQVLAQGVCHYCQETFKQHQLTMDHIVPIAQGGTSTKANVVAACKACNTAKGHTSPLDQAFDLLAKRKGDD